MWVDVVVQFYTGKWCHFVMISLQRLENSPQRGEMLCSVAAESLAKSRARVLSRQRRLTRFTGTLLPSSTPARDCVPEPGCRQKWDGMTWVHVANGEW